MYQFQLTTLIIKLFVCIRSDFEYIPAYNSFLKGINEMDVSVASINLAPLGERRYLAVDGGQLVKNVCFVFWYLFEWLQTL